MESPACYIPITVLERELFLELEMLVTIANQHVVAFLVGIMSTSVHQSTTTA